MQEGMAAPADSWNKSWPHKELFFSELSGNLAKASAARSPGKAWGKEHATANVLGQPVPVPHSTGGAGGPGSRNVSKRTGRLSPAEAQPGIAGTCEQHCCTCTLPWHLGEFGQHLRHQCYRHTASSADTLVDSVPRGNKEIKVPWSFTSAFPSEVKPCKIQISAGRAAWGSFSQSYACYICPGDAQKFSVSLWLL